MEPLSWGGVFAADFIPYFAFFLAIALVAGLVAFALTIVRSDPRNAMLLIGGAALATPWRFVGRLGARSSGPTRQARHLWRRDSLPAGECAARRLGA